MKIVDTVTILGNESFVGGTYILRMTVLRDVSVQFGRFLGGEPVLIPHGELVYLGSAMRGLASRVLRHALRTGGKPKHTIYQTILGEVRKTGLVNNRFRPSAEKKLHWHIDYLLDETAVSLTHAILFRSQNRLEDELGAWLLAQPETIVLLPGLGASDVKGHTHLLGLQKNSEGFWARYKSFVDN